MLLMALVDYCGSGLEASPYLLAQLLSHGTGLAVLLMKLLQLMECADDILLICEFLRSLAELCLGLKILLEVVLACL